jgi:BASS family bile acid:Na+ symporter
MENAKQIIALLVQASMFLMIMAIAMESHWRNVVHEITHPRLLLRAIIAVYIVVPAVALALVSILSLPLAAAMGMILMAASPLAPLVPGKAVKSGGQRSYVLGLYLLLFVLAIAFVPLTMLLFDSIFERKAFVPVGVVAKIVFISGVIPIAIGLALAALFPKGARKAVPFLKIAAIIVLALFAVLVFYVAGAQFLALIGDGTIFAFALTVTAGIVAGHFLGGGVAGDGGTLAVIAAIRHPGIAIAIAHASGAPPNALAAILLFLLVGMVVLTVYSAWLKRQRPAATDDEEVASV